MDDRTAISHIKQGDLNGLEILVNRYQARAVHAAYLVVYDRALAEDITWTAFVKVGGGRGENRSMAGLVHARASIWAQALM